MKILIDNESKKVIFSFEDNVDLIFNAEEGFSPNVEFLDANGFKNFIDEITQENSTLVENINIPEDFIGSKYLYDSELENPWVLNPDWIDPVPTEEPAPE